MREAEHRWINHYTVNTRHNRKSYRSEVSDGIVDLLKPIILDGGGPLLSTGLDIKVDVEPGCAAFTFFEDGFPIVICGMCVDPGKKAYAWKPILETGVKLGITDLQIPPAVPWLAAIVFPGPSNSIETVRMIADAERCIAWTIIENNIV